MFLLFVVFSSMTKIELYVYRVFEDSLHFALRHTCFRCVLLMAMSVYALLLHEAISPFRLLRQRAQSRACRQHYFEVRYYAPRRLIVARGADAMVG